MTLSSIAEEVGAIFDSNKEIAQEFLSLLDEERTWKWWQRKFPGMLPGDEPPDDLRHAVAAADVDWWIESYHLAGRVERNGELWQLVKVEAEEG